MIFREYADEDFRAVVALWDACRLTRPWNPPEGDIALARDSGHGSLIVAEDEEGVVGSVMVGHDGHRGWLYYLAVAPTQQRRGLGRALVREAEKWLEARGVRKVQLMIRPENTEVLRFYAAIGYEEQPIRLMTRWLTRN